MIYNYLVQVIQNGNHSHCPIWFQIQRQPRRCQRCTSPVVIRTAPTTLTTTNTRPDLPPHASSQGQLPQSRDSKTLPQVCHWRERQLSRGDSGITPSLLCAREWNRANWTKGGITHAFVVEFENDGDREYYVHKDPAHQEFVKGVVDLVDKVQVIDFTHGVVV